MKDLYLVLGLQYNRIVLPSTASRFEHFAMMEFCDVCDSTTILAI